MPNQFVGQNISGFLRNLCQRFPHIKYSAYIYTHTEHTVLWDMYLQIYLQIYLHKKYHRNNNNLVSKLSVTPEVKW